MMSSRFCLRAASKQLKSSARIQSKQCWSLGNTYKSFSTTPRTLSALDTNERDDLTSRVLPQMTLSKGDATSLTPPPAPIPTSITPEARAKLRFEVKGNAIVTGGAGSLGFAAGKALLEHGLSGLMIFDVNPAEAAVKIEELQKEFPSAKIEFQKIDITDDQAVARGVEKTVEVLGSLDVVLCFAGVVGCEHAMDMTAAAWRKTLDINTTGSFFVAQAAAKQMKAQGTGGSIVFTASISGHRVNYPQPQISYNVSKAALLTLKNGLAAEWASYGIRVNSISPGYADTILNEGDGLIEARTIWQERNPTGRMAAPSELTGAVVLLSSSASTYMNGADIVVDGGQIVF